MKKREWFRKYGFSNKENFERKQEREMRLEIYIQNILKLSMGNGNKFNYD